MSYCFKTLFFADMLINLYCIVGNKISTKANIVLSFVYCRSAQTYISHVHVSSVYRFKEKIENVKSKHCCPF